MSSFEEDDEFGFPSDIDSFGWYIESKELALKHIKITLK